MARRRGTRRPSQPEIGPATSAWHVLELQKARQVLEGAPQPCSARGQHAPAVHHAVLAHGQARSQRRPRREHRRDLVPPPPSASDCVGPPRRRTGSAAGQHKGGHDVHGRLQHGPWPAGHAGADRARGQDRRRFAGADLAGAHSPRHIGERLGHDDHDPAARGQSGRRDEPKQRRTVVDPSLGHGQHPRQQDHTGCHEGRFPTRRTVLPPATKHVVLAALRRGRLPQLQELHPDAGERHPCPLRLRWHLRMLAPVFGRLGSSRSHGPLRREQGVDNWMASLARAGSNAEFREAVAEAAALHAHDELFSKDIEPEPAPEDPVDWAMAEASDDEDDAPMPDAPPELIDMPPAPATSDVELGTLHRIAPRVRRWTALSLNKNTQPSSCHIVLSVVTRVRCPVCGVSLLSHVSVVFVLCVLPRLPDSDKKVSVFFLGGLKSVDTR